MLESEFWDMLNKMREKGSISMKAGSFDRAGNEFNPVSEYIHGHSILPEGYDCLSYEVIKDIGNLLLSNTCSLEAKKAIIMLLAHQPVPIAVEILSAYCEFADPSVDIYAKLGLDECVMWQN